MPRGGTGVRPTETASDADPVRYLALLVQVITGMRFGELRALRKENLDLTVPGLWVRPTGYPNKSLTSTSNARAIFASVRTVGDFFPASTSDR